MSVQKREDYFRAKLARLAAPGNKRMLQNLPRLQAALALGELFDQVRRKTGMTQEQIESDLSTALRRLEISGSTFRIERWRLPRRVTEVTSDLVSAYKDKAQPQRHEKVYYAATRHLAAKLGQDPFEAQRALFLKIGIGTNEAQAGGAQASLDQSHRVLALFRELASTMGTTQDLAALWARANAMNVGTSFLRPEPIRHETDFRRAFDLFWPKWSAGDATKALGPVDFPSPRAPILRVPLFYVEDQFNVYPVPGGNPGSCSVKGRLDSWIEISFAITRNAKGDGFDPALSFAYDHVLVLDAASDFPGFRGRCLTSDGQEDIEGMLALMSDAGCFETDDGHRWGVDWNNFPPDAETGDDLNDRSADVPSGRWAKGGKEIYRGLQRGTMPLTVASMQNLLLPSGLLPWADNAAAAFWCLSPAPADAAIAPVCWTSVPSHLRNLELAMHDGSLEAGLRDWISRYSAALDAKEEGWLTAAQADDDRLRQRWAAERQKVTGISPQEAGQSTPAPTQNQSTGEK